MGTSYSCKRTQSGQALASAVDTQRSIPGLIHPLQPTRPDSSRRIPKQRLVHALGPKRRKMEFILILPNNAIYKHIYNYMYSYNHIGKQYLQSYLQARPPGGAREASRRPRTPEKAPNASDAVLKLNPIAFSNKAYRVQFKDGAMS